jgi:hypothetical protein
MDVNDPEKKMPSRLHSCECDQSIGKCQTLVCNPLESPISFPFDTWNCLNSIKKKFTFGWIFDVCRLGSFKFIRKVFDKVFVYSAMMLLRRLEHGR